MITDNEQLESTTEEASGSVEPFKVTITVEKAGVRVFHLQTDVTHWNYARGGETHNDTLSFEPVKET